MRKFTLMFIVVLVTGIHYVIAQNIQITGTVRDENGNPMVGVSVVVTGTTRGVTTNGAGFYSIMAPGESTLRFTFLGYQTLDVPVNNRTGIDVDMYPAVRGIEDIVVVAYGTAKRASITGSVATVSAQELEMSPAISFEKALQGLAPGLQVMSVSGQPGSASTVRIRGVGSISSSSSPLYVIDGIVFDTDNLSRVASSTYGTSSTPLAAINPNDIESISILKDASAASLYGSRASNGVIVITTKRGRRDQAQITFRTQLTFSGIPKGYSLTNGAEHYRHYFLGRLNFTLNSDGTPKTVAQAHQETQDMYGRNPYNVDIPLDANGNLVEGARLMIDNSWKDALTRRGFTQEYDLGASGGTEKSQYMMAFGYMNQRGVVLASDFSRYTGRVNLNSEVKPWATMGINSMFSTSLQDTPVGAAGGASALFNSLNMPNLVSVYNLDENFQRQYDEAGNVLYNFDNPLNPDMNPVAFATTDIYRTRNYRALLNPFVNIKFIDGLNWRTSLAYDYTNYDEMRWYDTEHGNGASVNGRLYKYAIWQIDQTLSSTLTYDFKVLDDHTFSLLAGYEAFKRVYKYNIGHSTDFGLGSLLKELQMGTTIESVESIRDLETMVSWFGRVNYDYLEKYYISLSLRADGSSRFASGHRWGTFYSIGANWRIGRESFLEDKHWIDDLRLRATYGTSGNNKLPVMFGFLGLYDAGAKYDGGLGLVYSQLANPRLTWEKSENFNVGVDFSFLQRLNGSIDFFVKNTRDLFLERPLPTSTGLASFYANTGRMRNTGLEFELHSTNIIMEDFTWKTDFNLTWYRNKITNYPQEEQIVNPYIRKVGVSIYEFYMQKWAGVDPETGSPLWYRTDEDGNIVTTSVYGQATRYRVGSALPKVYGGLNNSLNYMGVELSFLLTYSFGGKIYDGYEAYLSSDGRRVPYNLLKDALDSWTPDNPNASYPKFVVSNASGSDSQSTRFLHKRDFIKIRNINLSYNLPKKWANTAKLENIRVYFSIDNVVVWNLDSKFKGYDVEMFGISGFDSGAGTVPLTRNFILGLNLTF